MDFKIILFLCFWVTFVAGKRLPRKERGGINMFGPRIVCRCYKSSLMKPPPVASDLMEEPKAGKRKITKDILFLQYKLFKYMLMMWVINWPIFRKLSHTDVEKAFERRGRDRVKGKGGVGRAASQNFLMQLI